MSDIIKIYVAASSNEMDRAVHWMNKLRDLAPYGVEVVSTWPEDIRDKQQGVPNPRSATREARRAMADRNLDQVEEADLFWLLAPSPESINNHGRGCYAELIAAVFTGVPRTVSSGDTRQSVFTALTTEFATDEEAFDAIKALVEG